MTQPSDPSAATDAGHDPALRDQAQHWVARLAARDISEAELDRLDEWLAADTDNRRAFARERALWQDLHAVADALVEPHVEAANVVQLPPALLSRRRMMRFAPIALAASLAAFVMGPSLIIDLRADHRTAAGEVRTLALSDGTTAMLDSGSAISVDFSDGQRVVHLLEGRAWFDVHHEGRPFMVTALGGVTRDIGTGFEVRHEGDIVEVSVTEGSVQVRAPDGTQGKPLMAGERTRYSAAGLDPLAPLPTSQFAAWRKGEILFEKQPVTTAIAEIARYRRATIWTLGDFGKVAPVSGVFLVERPDEALQTLARMRGLRVTTLPGGHLIVRPGAPS